MKALNFNSLATLLFFLSLNIIIPDMNLNAQEGSLPYDTIPDYPESYNAATVSARLIDGLGFRYYWATEGLRAIDLEYAPDSSARTCDETLYHIHDLSETIVNAVTLTTNLRPRELRTQSYEELRAITLNNLKTAADILRNSDGTQMEDFKLVYKRGDRESEYPFWHNLNGPIADALWHCGQVVSMRRASGNPFDSRVSVFSGKVRGR